MISLEPMLPRQQEEPADWPHPVHSARSRRPAGSPSRSRPGTVVDLMVQPSASQRRYPSAPPSRPSSSGAAVVSYGVGRSRGGVGAATAAAAKPPPPGSASASASQVEALLRRLGELEETVVEQDVSADTLKEVNVALMDRLTEFQSANEANVSQAEEELAKIHGALQAERAARAEVEAALAQTQAVLEQQIGFAANAGEVASAESARTNEVSEQLRLLMLSQASKAAAPPPGCRAPSSPLGQHSSCLYAPAFAASDGRHSLAPALCLTLVFATLPPHTQPCLRTRNPAFRT